MASFAVEHQSETFGVRPPVSPSKTCRSGIKQHRACCPLTVLELDKREEQVQVSTLTVVVEGGSQL